jgi:hypothetical protein
MPEPQLLATPEPTPEPQIPSILGPAASGSKMPVRLRMRGWPLGLVQLVDAS